MFDSRHQTLFRLSKLHGVGSATLWKIANTHAELIETPEELSRLHHRVAEALANSGAWDRACLAAEADIDQAKFHQAHILHGGSPLYPPFLRDSSKSPFFLYVRGRAENLTSRCVAIIGTRQPTTHGQEIARRITGYFADAGWCVVSGLAIGCDSIAHQVCVQRKSPTIAVLAHGLQTIAPKQNSLLAEQILESGGTLVSEYSFGTEPSPNLFVQRDFIQALLSAGVVMIQSDKSGGSLHAAGHALKLGRILAVPMPTELDRAKSEPKIQANLAIASMDACSLMSLFGVKDVDLDRIFVIRDKNDYPELVGELEQKYRPDKQGLFGLD